jgi:hypothetical protein
MPRHFVKDPDSVLDYKFDFAASTNGTGTGDWLASGETIASRTVTVDTGLTKDSDSITDSNTSVTVWLSGGAAGTEYNVACEVVTSASRTVERTMVIYVETR